MEVGIERKFQKARGYKKHRRELTNGDREIEKENVKSDRVQDREGRIKN